MQVGTQVVTLSMDEYHDARDYISNAPCANTVVAVAVVEALRSRWKVLVTTDAATYRVIVAPTVRPSLPDPAMQQVFNDLPSEPYTLDLVRVP